MNDQALRQLLIDADAAAEAPVVAADSKLVGMVTEFDLLLAIDYVGETTTISRIMTITPLPMSRG